MTVRSQDRSITRFRFHALAIAFLVLSLLPSVVGAQGQSPDTGAGDRFLISLIVFLVLSVLAAEFATEETRETLSELNGDPASAFGWGLLVGVLVPVGLVLLARTTIGLLITIPGILALAVLGIVGTAVTVVWVGDRFLRHHEDKYVIEAVLGSLILAILAAVPVVGHLLLWFAILFGLGVVSKRLYARGAA